MMQLLGRWANHLLMEEEVERLLLVVEQAWVEVGASMACGGVEGLAIGSAGNAGADSATGEVEVGKEGMESSREISGAVTT